MPRRGLMGRGCVNCGDEDCEFIDLDERCPHPVKCYECGAFGHIGRDCGARTPDPDMKNWKYLLRVAEPLGWQTRSNKNGDTWDENNDTLFLINDKGVKIDIYCGTTSIKTTMNHPIRGRNALFRPGYHCEKKLVEILKDPRVHSGVGYRSEARATWLCRECPNVSCRKERSEFSSNQWKRRSKTEDGKIVCLECQGR